MIASARTASPTRRAARARERRSATQPCSSMRPGPTGITSRSAVAKHQVVVEHRPGLDPRAPRTERVDGERPVASPRVSARGADRSEQFAEHESDRDAEAQAEQMIAPPGIGGWFGAARRTTMRAMRLNYKA